MHIVIPGCENSAVFISYAQVVARGDVYPGKMNPYLARPGLIDGPGVVIVVGVRVV